MYADIKFITRGMHAIRMVGEYNTINGMRNRSTVISVFKLSSWEEAKLFNKDISAFEGQAVAVFQFDHMPVSRGSFVYKDIVALDEIQEVVSDVFYKRSASYVAFLDEVMAEKETGKTNSPAQLGQPVSTVFKPKGIPANDSVASHDGFPF